MKCHRLLFSFDVMDVIMTLLIESSEAHLERCNFHFSCQFAFFRLFKDIGFTIWNCDVLFFFSGNLSNGPCPFVSLCSGCVSCLFVKMMDFCLFSKGVYLEQVVLTAVCCKIERRSRFTTLSF